METAEQITLLQKQVADTKELLARYILHVSACEGTDFLGSNWKSKWLTQENRDAIELVCNQSPLFEG